jgi:hypothetical protein
MKREEITKNISQRRRGAEEEGKKIGNGEWGVGFSSSSFLYVVLYAVPGD